MGNSFDTRWLDLACEWCGRRYSYNSNQFPEKPPLHCTHNRGEGAMCGGRVRPMVLIAIKNAREWERAQLFERDDP